MRAQILLISVISLGLSACSSGAVRDTLGMGNRAPNAFNVVSLPPLSVPPEFYLPAPTPGEPARGVGRAEDVARRTLLNTPAPLDLGGGFGIGADSGSGALDDFMALDPAANALSDAASTLPETAVTPVLSSTLPSAAESRLLDKLGADAADPTIRAKLYEDSKFDVQQEPSSPLAGWLGLDSAPSDAVVNAGSEAERIRKAAEEGTPINAGEVPVEDNAPNSLLDSILE